MSALKAGDGAADDLWMLKAVRDGVPAFALFGSVAHTKSFERLHTNGDIETVNAEDGFKLTAKGLALLAKLGQPTEPQPRDPTALEAMKRAVRP